MLLSSTAEAPLFPYRVFQPLSSSAVSKIRFQVRESSITKVVWIPPECGDVVACISGDGALSLWEEVTEDTEGNHWKMCKCFDGNISQVLDVLFGHGQTCLKLKYRLGKQYGKELGETSKDGAYLIDSP